MSSTSTLAGLREGVRVMDNDRARLGLASLHQLLNAIRG